MRTVQQLINGVAIGGVYALFATGYTLVFSVLRIVNLAHGAVFTLGAYLTYLLMGSPVGVNGVLHGFHTGHRFWFVSDDGSDFTGKVADDIKELTIDRRHQAQIEILKTKNYGTGVTKETYRLMKIAEI